MSELLGSIFQNGTFRSPHVSGRALRALSACTVLALVGCGESSVGPTQAGPTLELPDISAARVAASNIDGVDNFHFLPPIAPEQEFTGTFDADLDPEVVICGPGGSPCATPVATFTTAPGSGSETIRVDSDEEHYVVNWHTRGLDPGDYTISVSVDGSELGHAEVAIVTRGKDLGVKRGRTLPIKFRIEVAGDVCTGTGAFDDLDGVSGNLDATTGQIGFDGWEYGSTSADWLMLSNSAFANTTDASNPVVFARTSSDIADFASDCGAFTTYADHTRAFGPFGAHPLWAGGHGWFADGAGAASSATTTGVIVVFRGRAGGIQNADIFLERYDDSGTRVEQHTIATDLSFPRNSGRRLGADVSADGVTVVVWTEPLGGGARTIYDAVELSSDIRDADHRRGSLVAGTSAGSPTFTTDFTVEPLDQ